MAVIKNKALLVERAKWHAKTDHIVQGTYGSGKTNGLVEFEGCAIGCLATPHGESALRAWLREVIRPSGKYADHEYDMVARLEEEFGIVPELARLAEGLFEALPYHGGAINFVPRFAEALPEGAEINGDDVNRIWRSAFPTGRVDPEIADSDASGLYRTAEMTRRADLILEVLALQPVIA